jgi:hypothetical protein
VDSSFLDDGTLFRPQQLQELSAANIQRHNNIAAPDKVYTHPTALGRNNKPTQKHPKQGMGDMANKISYPNLNVGTP